METVRTLKLRIKDKHAKAMLAMARDVDMVWNYCNETQYRSRKRYCNRPKVWLSGFDLQKLTAGFSKCEGVAIDSRTTQEVCKEFATRLKQFKRQKLNWRVSRRGSPRYSLNGHGQVRARCRVVNVQNTTQVQGPLALRRVRGSGRSVFHPNVLVLRRCLARQSER